MIETTSQKQLTLQNVTIGDAKACCKLAVWETLLVGQLEEGKTYKIKDVTVKQYNYHKSLSTTTDIRIEEASDRNISKFSSEGFHSTIMISSPITNLSFLLVSCSCHFAP